MHIVRPAEDDSYNSYVYHRDTGEENRPKKPGANWLFQSAFANSAFRPSGVGKWVVIDAITWITKVATIKRQTGAAYGC